MRKTSRRFLSIFLSLAMLLCMMPGLALPAYAVSWTEYSNYYDMKNAIRDLAPNGVLYAKLMVDCDASGSTGQIVITDGKTVNLDLNGHVIARNDTSQGMNIFRVNSGCTLNISDSSPSTPHTLYKLDCGTYTTDSTSGGTAVNVNGGVLTGAWGDTDGGAICNIGTLTMAGGTICGNKAGNKGGGVCNYSRITSSFTMTGGKICDNSITGDSGGGVYNIGAFTMTGGEISGNSVPAGAKGGGVFHDNGAENGFRLSGSVNISGNTAGTAASNVYVGDYGDGRITVSGVLNPTSPIGVMTYYPEGGDNYRNITSGYNTYMESANVDTIFASDDPAYKIEKKANGELKLGLNHTHSFTYEVSGNTLTATCSNTEGCSLASNDYKVTLTLYASDAGYGGSAYSGAGTNVSSFNTATGKSASVSYTYEGTGTTTYESSSTAPTARGTYKVVASVTGLGDTPYVIEKAFEITKGTEPTPTSGEVESALLITYTPEAISVKPEEAENYELAASNTGAAITDFSAILDQASPKVYVRKKARSEDYNPSAWKEVGLTPRPAAPSGFTTTNAEHGASLDGKISGVTTDMEYSTDGGITWNEGTGADITGLNPGEYLVRVKATSSVPHSVVATVTVGSNYVALTESNAPTISVSGSHNPPQVGDTLTVETTATNLTYTWHYYEAIPGGESIELIPGATSNTYTLTAADLDKKIFAAVYQTKKNDGTDYAANEKPQYRSDPVGPVDPVHIELSGDRSDPIAVSGGEALCLDLNGHTLSGNITVASNGKLIIIDSSVGGKVTGTVANQGEMIIEDGRFTNSITSSGHLIIADGVFNGTITNVKSNPSDICAVSIMDGYFDERPVATNETIYIIGGYFKVDPTKAANGTDPNPNVEIVPDDKCIVYVDSEEYHYQLADKPNTAADVKIDQGATAGSTSVTGTDAGAAEAVANSTQANLEATALDQVKKIVNSSQSVTDSNKNIVIVPSLTVETETYVVSGSDTTLTLNIEARYTSYETTSDVTNAAEVQTSLTNQDGKATQIGSGTLDTKGTPVIVRFEVPTAFAAALGATSSHTYLSPLNVYVRHTHEGKNYQYPAKLFYDSSEYFVEFVNPNGFSPFTLAKTSESIVHINVGGDNRYYTDFQSAIDDAEDGATIVLEQNQDVSGSLNQAKTITVDKTAHPGADVNITAGSGFNVTATDNGDDTITFTATKKHKSGNTTGGTTEPVTPPAEEPVPTPVPEQPTTTGNVAGFKDVKAGQWYSDGIEYVVGKGYMSGYSTDTFAPFDNTSRAMMAQVFFNIEKGDVAGAMAALYTDVDAAKWYAKAVNWATENGIMDGYGHNLFGPNDPVTREQLVTIIYRYAKKKGADVSRKADISKFADAGKVGSWALDAMQWAVGCGLISGKTATTLNPGDNATRAEIATIIMRYCEMM